MDASLHNEDLAPTKPEERTWSKWHIASLWVGMAVCIPTYGLAAGLVANGASLGLAVTAVAIGNLIVLFPLILNGHPGAKYGIPFPVLIRSSFGPVGAHIPTMIRALVACGWFGIQTWIGGKALHILGMTLFPQVELPNLVGFLGIGTGEFLAFFVFWLLNVAIILKGVEALKVFETLAAPFLLLGGLILFLWAWHKVGDVGSMISPPATTAPGELAGTTAPGMAPWDALAMGITGAVAFWGTLALNIPDFTRYAKNQRAQAIGQAISLPTTMTFFVFIGAAITNATLLIFGERVADPVKVLARIASAAMAPETVAGVPVPQGALSQVGGIAVVLLALLGVAVATLSTNLAANVVSPANGFANLAPQKINFRKGAMLTAMLGFVIMPWKIWGDPDAYVVTWLVGCGGLLGAVGGIMIADYFVYRKTLLDVADLYRRGGRYEFKNGKNPVALIALALALAPLVPGFLGSLEIMDPPAFLADLYKWSWFVAFILAGGLYLVGMRLFFPSKTD